VGKITKDAPVTTKAETSGLSERELLAMQVETSINILKKLTLLTEITEEAFQTSITQGDVE